MKDVNRMWIDTHSCQRLGILTEPNLTIKNIKAHIFELILSFPTGGKDSNVMISPDYRPSGAEATRRWGQWLAGATGWDFTLQQLKRSLVVW